MLDTKSFDKSSLAPLLDQLSDGIAIVAPDSGSVLYANAVLASWLGKSSNELQSTSLQNLFHPEVHVELLDLARKICQGTLEQAAVTAHLSIDDLSFEAADVRLCRVIEAEAVLLGVAIRREKRLPLGITASATRSDPLTGLADRQFLFDRLTGLLRGETSSDRRFAVLFVDLDNFKQVNDAHGHLIGDSVLREVARRLQGCVRDGDHVVRFGGDEFVVLVEGVDGPSESESIVRRIQAALARPIALPHGEFSLSLSIGVAQASPDHHSPEELLHAADRAMYAAKRNAQAPS
jgi:diguanylate cyclase (GGDEF)-like protein